MVAVTLVTVAGRRHRLELDDGSGSSITGGRVYAAAGELLSLEPGRFKLLLRGAPLPGAGPQDAAVAVKLADGGEKQNPCCVVWHGLLSPQCRGRQGGRERGGEQAQQQHRRAAARRPTNSAHSPTASHPQLATNRPAAPSQTHKTDALVVVPQRRTLTEAAAAAAAEALGGGGTAADDDDYDGPVRFELPRDAPDWHRRLALFLRRRCRAPDLALAWLFLLGPGRLLVLVAVLTGARVAHAFGLGPPYLMLAIVVAMLRNLGERRAGEASAYSIFNPGVRRLPGQLDAEAFDEQIRRGAGIG